MPSPAPTRRRAPRPRITSSLPRPTIKWSADMNHPSMSRRHFMQRAGALAALGAGSGFHMLAHAQGASDYKALVCVFLYGGNDGNNTVIPFDTAGYAQYSAVRTAASGIQLAQASLLPIQPVST